MQYCKHQQIKDAFFPKTVARNRRLAHLKEHLKRAISWLTSSILVVFIFRAVFLSGKIWHTETFKKCKYQTSKGCLKKFSLCWHFETTVYVKSVQTRAKNVMYYALVLKFKEERFTLFCNNYCLSKDPWLLSVLEMSLLANCYTLGLATLKYWIFWKYLD